MERKQNMKTEIQCFHKRPSRFEGWAETATVFVLKIYSKVHWDQNLTTAFKDTERPIIK